MISACTLQSQKLKLSKEEREWLKYNQSIIVAPEKNFPPFAFIDDKGFFKGISSDYLSEIENQLGVSFIIAPPFHLSKNLELIRQEEIDIITSLKLTKERIDYMNFSVPYIEIPTVIITRKIDKVYLDISDLKGFHIGVGENYAVHEYLRNNYPDLVLQAHKDDLEGLKKLSLGQLDAIIMDLASASYLTGSSGITNLFISGEIDFTYDLCMASVKSKPMINQLLNKAIQNISQEKKSEIKEKWIHLNGPDNESRYIEVVVILVIVVLLFSLAILFFKDLLKRKISEKTLELQLQVKDNKMLEEELMRSIGKQKAWYVNAPLPYQSLTTEGEIDEVNSEWLKSLGYERGEVVGKWFGDFLEEESRVRFENNLSSVFVRKYIKDVQFKIQHKNGELIEILLNGKVSKDAIDGKFKTYCVFQNISRQVKNDTELKKFKEAIEQSPVCVVMTDSKGNIEFANKQFELLTGYSFDEVLGKNPSVLNAGTQAKEYYQSMWETIASGETWTGEFHNKKKNGELFWETAVISPVKDKNGHISNYIAVKEDVTERKKLWKELVVAKEKAMESDKIKSAFLANMSHELRTPLNAIIGFSELINHDLSKEEIISYVDIINNSGKNLTKIVSNIFDISLLQTDEIKVNLTNIDIQGLFTTIYDKATGEQSHEKLNKIALKTEFGSDCMGRELHSDSYLLSEVLLHMVHNAFKFTIKGEVILKCSLKVDDGIEYVRFSISDTGIGISEENQAVIFKNFKKVNHSSGELYAGVGIGLSISKRLIEILGGEIKVQSIPGQGSEFSFTLPLHFIKGN